MERDGALKRLESSELSEFELSKEYEFVASKLDLSTEELKSIFEGDNKTYKNYKNKKPLIGLGYRILSKLGIEKRLFK